MNDDERRLISSSRQEQRLVLTRFGDADAWGWAVRWWRSPTGTTAESDAWLDRKVNVVYRFATASYLAVASGPREPSDSCPFAPPRQAERCPFAWKAVAQAAPVCWTLRSATGGAARHFGVRSPARYAA